MIKDLFKGQLRKVKSILKQRWGKFINNTRLQIEGCSDEILGKIERIRTIHTTSDDLKNSS